MNGNVQFLVLVQIFRLFIKVHQENRHNRLSITRKVDELEKELVIIFIVVIIVQKETKNCMFFHLEDINTLKILIQKNYAYNI